MSDGIRDGNKSFCAQRQRLISVDPIIGMYIYVYVYKQCVCIQGDSWAISIRCLLFRWSRARLDHQFFTYNKHLDHIVQKSPCVQRKRKAVIFCVEFWFTRERSLQLQLWSWSEYAFMCALYYISIFFGEIHDVHATSHSRINLCILKLYAHMRVCVGCVKTCHTSENTVRGGIFRALCVCVPSALIPFPLSH